MLNVAGNMLDDQVCASQNPRLLSSSNSDRASTGKKRLTKKNDRILGISGKMQSGKFGKFS
jgi:hypothetical protein